MSNCEEIIFDDELWSENLATTFELVCDRSHLKSLSNYAWFFGVFLNSFTSQVPDIFGRRKAFLLGQALLVITTFLCALATSILTYSVCRIFHGLFVGIAETDIAIVNHGGISLQLIKS